MTTLPLCLALEILGEDSSENNTWFPVGEEHQAGRNRHPFIATVLRRIYFGANRGFCETDFRLSIGLYLYTAK